MKILLATKSADKLREMRAVLRLPTARFVSLDELGLNLPLPPETGASFEANARLKAEAYFAASGLPALTEDSGFCVDALAGLPGIFSSRVLGDKDYDEKNRVILRLMNDVPPPLRTCRYVCAAAFYDGRAMLATRGEVEGTVAFEARGRGGFGYDPIFFLEGLGKTMAELAPAEKNALSHRFRALEAMSLALRDYLDGAPAGAKREAFVRPSPRPRRRCAP